MAPDRPKQVLNRSEKPGGLCY